MCRLQDPFETSGRASHKDGLPLSASRACCCVLLLSCPSRPRTHPLARRLPRCQTANCPGAPAGQRLWLPIPRGCHWLAATASAPTAGTREHRRVKLSKSLSTPAHSSRQASHAPQHSPPRCRAPLRHCRLLKLARPAALRSPPPPPVPAALIWLRARLPAAHVAPAQPDPHLPGLVGCQRQLVPKHEQRLLCRHAPSALPAPTAALRFSAPFVPPTSR